MIANKFILLVHDHYNPLGMVRSLGEMGIRPIVILVSERVPYLVNKSRYIGKLHIVKTIDEGYSIILRDYGNEKLKPFIYTGSDGYQSFIDMHYDELVEKFYFWNSGRQGAITKLMEKYAQCLLAEKCGFKVPKIERVKVGELPKIVGYPLITKSANSLRLGWKDQVFICNTEEELQSAYSKMKDSEVLVQEFIKKKNELCIDGLCINGGKDLYIPLQDYYYRIPDGDYGQYFYLERFEDEELRTKINRIFMESNFSGIFTIEFLVGLDDNLYFQEINYRNSGWSYGLTACGVNLPYIYAKSVLKGVIDDSEVQISTKLPFNVMDEFQEFVNNVFPKRRMSFWEYLKEVHSNDCFLYYNKKDNRPFRSYVWHNFRKTLNISKLVKFIVNTKRK